MNPFRQEHAACRCEWGPGAVTALAPADVTIVVDVFSFTTCVDVATSRGAVILPYPWNDPSAAESAAAHGAELAGRRGKARYSLAPESYLEAPAGLRCVLPSPNGAQVTLLAAQTSPVVFAGCLRNARAVAAAAACAGSSFNVVPAGERWPDGTLRPALEDWLGAGAILHHLPGVRSPEAEARASGREMEGRGNVRDKRIAGQLDVSDCAPRFERAAYIAA